MCVQSDCTSAVNGGIRSARVGGVMYLSGWHTATASLIQFFTVDYVH